MCIIIQLIGAVALTNSYTEGTWYVYFRDLNCTGHEETLFDCPYQQLTDSSCSQYEDASVICQCKIIPCQLTVFIILT